MEKGIVDYSVKYTRSEKIEDAEARVFFPNKEALKSKNAVLDACSTTGYSGFGVRILRDGEPSFASSNKWTRKGERIGKILSRTLEELRKFIGFG